MSEAGGTRQGANAGERGGKPLWLKLLLGAVIVAAGFLLLRFLTSYFGVREKLIAALDWVEGLGIWAPVIYILIYIACTVFFIPGSIVTLGAGLIWGVVEGTIYVSIASTVGATVAFLVGRYLMRDWVARRISGNRKFEAIDEAVGREGWKIVGLTRLSPIFPFNLLNYAFGLTKVSLWGYVLASWVGMLPGTVVYVWLGSLGKNLTELGTEEQGNPAVEWTIRIVGGVVAIGVTAYVTRLARRALREKADLD